MPHGLPERISPLRLSRRGERLDGTFDCRRLPRLLAAVTDCTGGVSVSLTFQREGRDDTVRGKVNAMLVLCCQRCLEPMPWPAEVEVATRFVAASAADDDSGLESVQLDEDGSTSLRDLVEDELLLAMPQFPLHDEQECPVRRPADAPTDEQPRPNPFAVLAGMKTGD